MIRRLAKSPLTRLFSTSVIDQALLSAANFLVGILLIRHAPDQQQYGLYILAFSTVQLLVSAQGSWVGGPLVVLAPKRSAERRREMISSVERDQKRVLRWTAGLIAPMPFIGAALGLWSHDEAWVAFATVFAGWMTLRREFLRSALFIYGRPQSVLASDILYTATLLTLVAVSLQVEPAIAAAAVMSIGLAAGLARWSSHRSVANSVGWQTPPDTHFWAEMRALGAWATAGAMIYWIYGQSYNFVLAHRMDLHAVAEVNVVRLLLMPLSLMSLGVSNVLIPNVSTWLHHEGLPVVARRLVPFVLGLLALQLLYIGLLWATRGWVMSEVMRKTIAQVDSMILLWALANLIAMTRDVFQSALIALGRFKVMAVLTGVAAIGSLSTMWYCIDRFGALGAIIGVAVGEGLSLIGVLGLLTLSLQRGLGKPGAVSAG